MAAGPAEEARCARTVGAEREARKKRREPLLKKNMTSELGNITPVVVVPGPWTPEELEFQSRSLAGMVSNNAAFNCNAAKLIITPKGWSGRERLFTCGPIV